MDEKTPLQIQILLDADSLQKHIAAWDDLAAHAVEPNVFYESWHLLPAISVFGPQNSRFVLIFAAPQGQKPILCGFFPLQLRKRYKGLPLRVLSLWNHDYGSLCLPLLRAGYEKECLHTFFDWLRHNSGVALFSIDELGADGPFHRYWIEVLHERALLSFTDETYTRAFLQPDCADAETYFHQALSRKRRKELKRLENRLGELGCLTYEVVAADQIEKGIEEFLQLEASGWKGKAGTAFANQVSHGDFFRQIGCEAARRGRLMLLALRLDGRPLAMKFNLLAGEGAFACKIAFDENFARYSPGVLLELENIRQLQENPTAKWMDSCAIPDHFMINRLWTERRLMQNLVLSSGSIAGDLVVSLLPLLRFFKRRLKKPKQGEIYDRES